MTKTKKTVKILTMSAVVALCAVCVPISATHASAESVMTTSETDIVQEMAVSEENPERLLTNLGITLNGENGEVWATVKNRFTLFPSTVYVIVQLYRSDTYCEDYKEMTLVSANSTMDLDMGHTIEARGSTEGRESYWMGRMRYKIDNDPWDERTVGVGRYSADGEFLGIL